jgi:predicted dehydrogenase
MARLKAAVIGLGRIASTIDEELDDFDGVEFPYGHIPCYMSMPEVEVVGMSDTWVEQREAAGAKWGFEALYADYRQMLEETRPDIVSVCTSAKPRGDILLEIANGGYGVRAIWAEKPITLSLAEADAAIDACKRANIALAINCTRCWRDDYLQVKALIDEGAIGDVVSVDSRSMCSLSHNGSHLITTLTMYVPERAVSVVGEAELDEANPDNDFSGVGLIRFPGKVRGYVRAYDNGPNESSHDIVGTDGMIRMMNDARSVQIWTTHEALAGHQQHRERRSFVRRNFPPPVRRHSGGVNAVYDLIHCIESGDDPRCSGEDAREALEIAIAIRESERRGNQPVDLPLADRSARIISGEVVRSELPRAILRQREEAAQT